MRDVGNHEGREWTWWDIARDPVVWLLAGSLATLIMTVGVAL